MEISKEEAIALLTEYVANIERINAYYREVQQVLGTQPESRFSEMLFLLAKPAGALLEQCISSHQLEWIEWYIWENKGGRGGMSAGPTGALRPIRTVEDLYWLLTLEGTKAEAAV
jgi:hypothetical protein